MSSIETTFQNTATPISYNANIIPMTGSMVMNAPMPINGMLGRSQEYATMPNSGVSIYGGVTQGFTQFMDGVPVQKSGSNWMSAQNQTTTISPMDHPCKGKGGKDCGCGGSCKGTNIEDNIQNKENNIQNVEGDIDDLKTFIRPEVYQEKLLKNTPGNSSLMTATFPNGKHITSVAKVLSDRTIVLETTEISKKKQICTCSFPFQSDGTGWSVIINGKKVPDVNLPLNTTLDSIAYGGLIGSIGSELISAKIDKMSEMRSEPLSTPPACAEPGTLCTPHDMVCSEFTDSGWPWTADHQHVQFWAPCIGSFIVDVGDCCHEHDRGMWCANEPVGLKAVNMKVIACITGKVWDKADELVKQMKNPISRIFCRFLVNGWQGDATFLSTVIMNETYDAYIVSLVLSGDKEGFTNFYFGDHSESCLCGGTKPTIMCSDTSCCRDLCKEFPKLPITENCTNCKCVCDYDKTGKLTGSHFNNPMGLPSVPGDPLDDTGCCPGTGFMCNGMSSTKPCGPAFTKTCPTCSECIYECIYDSSAKKVVPNLVHFIPGVKCCREPNKPDCTHVGQIV